MDASPDASASSEAPLRTHSDALAAPDVLVFHRIGPDRYAHLGGSGRGAGWAGIVELSVGEEAAAQALLAGTDPVRLRHERAERVIGPYYAVEAALVAATRDVFVVFGHPTGGSRLPTCSDDELRQHASAAAEQVQAVSPAKMLADELEVLHAVKAMTQTLTNSLEHTLQHIVDVAAEALSCERALVYTAGGRIGATAGTLGGEAGGADEAALRAALDQLVDRVTAGPICVQAAETLPLPSPLGPAEGVRSYYALPLEQPVGGVLVLLHLDDQPRGFTQLCRRIGVQLAEAAVVVLQVAVMRDSLLAQVDEHATAARLDPLTGLRNRRAWDEAVANGQAAVDSGARMTVITADVDGLKQVNDAHGHDAGDRLLRAAAEALSSGVRGNDLVARVGGDEFAILLPDLDDETVGPVLDRVRAALARADISGGVPLVASVGSAACPPCGSIADALQEADRRMYAEKRSRRS